jgi:hypothetical protein
MVQIAVAPSTRKEESFFGPTEQHTPEHPVHHEDYHVPQFLDIYRRTEDTLDLTIYGKSTQTGAHLDPVMSTLAHTAEVISDLESLHAELDTFQGSLHEVSEHQTDRLLTIRLLHIPVCTEVEVAGVWAGVTVFNYPRLTQIIRNKDLFWIGSGFESISLTACDPEWSVRGQID